MRFLKRMGLAALAVTTAGVSGWVAWLFLEYLNVPEPAPLTVGASPQKVTRGAHLFNNVARCVDCHSTRDWTKYAAPVIKGTEGKGGEAFTHALMGVPGEFHARNITPTPLAEWTDGEIARAITTGVNKHGEALFPVMPYRNYGELDPEDIGAIVAYIRTLKPQPDEVPDRSFHFPMQIMVRTLPRPGMQFAGKEFHFHLPTRVSSARRTVRRMPTPASARGRRISSSCASRCGNAWPIACSPRVNAERQHGDAVETARRHDPRQSRRRLRLPPQHQAGDPSRLQTRSDAVRRVRRAECDVRRPTFPACEVRRATCWGRSPFERPRHRDRCP